MQEWLRDVLVRSSAGEIAGAVVVALSVVALFASAVVFSTGGQLAFFGLLAAFVIGITGFGVHIASREARFRRDRR